MELVGFDSGSRVRDRIRFVFSKGVRTVRSGGTWIEDVEEMNGVDIK